MSVGAFLDNQKREIDAAWYSVARADLRHERGVWGNYEPTEAEIRERMAQMDAELTTAASPASKST